MDQKSFNEKQKTRKAAQYIHMADYLRELFLRLNNIKEQHCVITKCAVDILEEIDSVTQTLSTNLPYPVFTNEGPDPNYLNIALKNGEEKQKEIDKIMASLDVYKKLNETGLTNECAWFLRWSKSKFDEMEDFMKQNGQAVKVSPTQEINTSKINNNKNQKVNKKTGPSVDSSQEESKLLKKKLEQNEKVDLVFAEKLKQRVIQDLAGSKALTNLKVGQLIKSKLNEQYKKVDTKSVKSYKIPQRPNTNLNPQENDGTFTIMTSEKMTIYNKLTKAMKEAEQKKEQKRERIGELEDRFESIKMSKKDPKEPAKHFIPSQTVQALRMEMPQSATKYKAEEQFKQDQPSAPKKVTGKPHTVTSSEPAKPQSDRKKTIAELVLEKQKSLKSSSQLPSRTAFTSCKDFASGESFQSVKSSK